MPLTMKRERLDGIAKVAVEEGARPWDPEFPPTRVARVSMEAFDIFEKRVKAKETMKTMRAMKTMKAMETMKAMKIMKTMKAMKTKKTMKAMKKKKKVTLAQGKTAKSAVFRGHKTKTRYGLTKSKLMKNKEGKVVSIMQSRAHRKNFESGVYAEFRAWQEACSQARKALDIKGFCAVKKGSALYSKAKELYSPVIR